MFLNDCRQGSQGVIRLSRGRKHGGYIGLQNDHRTSGGVPRRILVALRIAEVVLLQDLIRRDGWFHVPFTPSLLHNLSARAV
jgi:hypothetical protein